MTSDKLIQVIMIEIHKQILIKNFKEICFHLENMKGLRYLIKFRVQKKSKVIEYLKIMLLLIYLSINQIIMYQMQID